MFGSSQGVLGLNREAAPEDEGYEGNARTHQQYEVLNALPKERGHNRANHCLRYSSKIEEWYWNSLSLKFNNLVF